MANSGNQHCANCIATLSFPISHKQTIYQLSGKGNAIGGVCLSVCLFAIDLGLSGDAAAANRL